MLALAELVRRDKPASEENGFGHVYSSPIATELSQHKGHHMTTSRFLLFVISAATVLLTASSDASLVPLSLEAMIAKADIIIIGEVIKHEKTNLSTHFFKATKELPIYKATVAASEVLKGDQSIKEIEVFHTLHPEDAQLGFHNLYKTAVYFLKEDRQSSGQYKVVGGFQGEVII